MSAAERRERRLRRARSVASGALADLDLGPDRWIWPALEMLPDWCLLDGEDAVLHRRVVGALRHVDVLRTWIEAAHVRMLCDVLGAARVDAVLDSVVALATCASGVDSGTAVGVGSLSETFRAPVAGESRDALAARLEQAGRDTLRAALEVIGTGVAEGSGDGGLSRHLAELGFAILHEADVGRAPFDAHRSVA